MATELRNDRKHLWLEGTEIIGPFTLIFKRGMVTIKGPIDRQAHIKSIFREGYEVYQRQMGALEQTLKAATDDGLLETSPDGSINVTPAGKYVIESLTTEPDTQEP